MEEQFITEEQVLDEVLSDWFPNATTEEELEYELDCWNND